MFGEETKPAWKLADTDAKTGTVLMTRSSSLVEVIIPESTNGSYHIITVDSENLLRFWDLRTQQTFTSYRLPLQGQVTSVVLDTTTKGPENCRYLAIGSTVGEVKVLNLNSGGVIYDFKSKVKRSDISILHFYKSQKYWLYGGFWEGRF